MKRFVSLLLVLLLSFGLLVACASTQGATVEKAVVEEDLTEYYNALTFTAAEQDGKKVLPELELKDGYAFRGFFTEQNGQGTRVTASNVGEYASFYAYVTKTVEEPEIRFIAFGSYPYSHVTETDEDGNTYEIGYRGTEEDFRMMREFGFDTVGLDFYIGDSVPKQWVTDSLNNLALCRQYYLRYCGSDNLSKDASLTVEQVREMTAFYADDPLFSFFGIADEPGFGALPGLRAIVDLLRAAYPEKQCHINYISYGLLNSRSGLREYYQYACDYINIDHLATDPYPYGDAENGYIGYNFYNELVTVANCARDGGKKLWLYAQTCTTYNPYGHMKFNAMADMAFGCTGFFQFCYANTHDYGLRNDGAPSSVLFDNLGNRTEAWYEYSAALKDCRAFGEVINNYEWKYSGGVAGTDTTYNYDALDVSHFHAFFDTDYTDRDAYNTYVDFVTDIQSDYGVVASAFVERNGAGDGLMFLNSTDMTKELSASVSFKLVDAVKVTVYHDADSEVLTADENGYYHVTVPSADGVFVGIDYYD